MTNEERDIITRLIERVGGARGTTGFGSVPSSAPPLPPIDPEADRLIGELFQKHPEARYRLAQTAYVQEQALAAAQGRIQQLETEALQARQMAEQAQQQGGARSGGFLSGLFGGGGQPRPAASPWGQPGAQQGYAAPPQGGYPAQGYAQQQMQPQMMQRSGSGFLGTALTTAAGVAGGMVVGNALMNLLSPGHAAASGFGGGMMPGAPIDNPWGSGGADPAVAPDQPLADQGYVDQGSWTTPDSTAGNDPGYTDTGSWDVADSGWSDDENI